jgi:hypothetical protein
MRVTPRSRRRRFTSCQLNFSLAALRLMARPAPWEAEFNDSALPRSPDRANFQTRSYAEVDAEQITADVASFCDLEFPPTRLCMTNCIVLGDIGSGSGSSMQNVVTTTEWPFLTANDGNYYLPEGSPYHKAGTNNISTGLFAELPHKSTYAPICFPSGMIISGQITLSPQAGRYTNGAPDLGYYYDALDYTIGNMFLEGGTMTVLRNTAIGFRNEFYGSLGMGNNSLFLSQGTPTQPITFVDNSLVQEGPFAPG